MEKDQVPEPRSNIVGLINQLAPQESRVTPLARGLADAVLEKVAIHDDEDTLYATALAAIDAFVSVRVRGASLKVSAFFDQLCSSWSWSSLAVFGLSKVVEDAFLAVNAPRKKLTVIDAGPDYSGREVAKRLGTITGVSVKYGVLADAHRLLEGCDALVLGAEELGMNGTALVGSGGAACVQAAREVGTSVVVVAQAAKLVGGVFVDWTVAGFDVVRPYEIHSIVTEMDMGTWNPASAPDVMKRVISA